MPFDGQYAAAQLWRLDSIRGRIAPLSTMLAEFLMLPAFPSARFKAWAEQHGRLFDAAILRQVTVRLMGHDDIPQHISGDAQIECKALRNVNGAPAWINYHGTVAQYTSQRETIFGTVVPTNVEIKEPLTDEEQAYLGEWCDRYECPWPYITGQWIEYRMPRRVHPQLIGLYERYKEFCAQWDEALEYEPFDGDFNYLVRNYYNGELREQISHMRFNHPLEGLMDDVEEETLRAPPNPPPLRWYPRHADGETDVPSDGDDIADDSTDEVVWD
jgi:hypothetical protein